MKKSFVEKVLIYLKGGDEAKILRFQKRAVRQLEETIKGLEYENETTAIKIEDAVAAVDDKILNINVENLHADRLDSYIAEYLKGILQAEKDVKDLEAKITANNEKIATSKLLIEKLSA